MESATTLPHNLFVSKSTWKVYQEKNGVLDFQNPLPVSVILNYKYVGENNIFEFYQLGCEDKILLIDDEAQCSLDELIRINSEPDVMPLSPCDIVEICRLNVHCYCYVGITKITRIR